MKAHQLADAWRDIPIDRIEQCWPWRGKRFPKGYGKFNIGQTSIGAHVAAYCTVNGEIPSGLFVMHKCNNKACCNPAHLTLGTNSQNQRHASGSGAWAVGVTGIRGVTFDTKRQYWIASGYLNGKRRNLYTGPHKHKAVKARQDWERENVPTFKEQSNEV